MRLPSLRFLLLSCLVVCNALRGELPRDMLAALDHFRTEGAPGYAYEQVSEGEGHSRREAFSPLGAEGLHWTLLSVDGHLPSEGELREYRLSKLQRSSATNAPRLEKQLDRSSGEVLEEKGGQLRCRFRLLPEGGDESLRQLAVDCTLDRASGSILRIEIFNTERLSPSLVVRIDSMRTVLEYSAQSAAEPSHLLHADIRVEGRAFWLKSLNQHLSVTWSNYKKITPGESKAP